MTDQQIISRLAEFMGWEMGEVPWPLNGDKYLYEKGKPEELIHEVPLGDKRKGESAIQQGNRKIYFDPKRTISFSVEWVINNSESEFLAEKKAQGLEKEVRENHPDHIHLDTREDDYIGEGESWKPGKGIRRRVMRFSHRDSTRFVPL